MCGVADEAQNIRYSRRRWVFSVVGVEFPVDSGGKSALFGSVEKFEVGKDEGDSCFRDGYDESSMSSWRCRSLWSDSGGVHFLRR